MVFSGFNQTGTFFGDAVEGFSTVWMVVGIVTVSNFPTKVHGCAALSILHATGGGGEEGEAEVYFKNPKSPTDGKLFLFGVSKTARFFGVGQKPKMAVGQEGNPTGDHR